MDKIHAVADQYRRFLVERQFATEKASGYMQGRVEQFLHFACGYRDEPFEQVLIRFEDMLAENKTIEPWQIKQANDAITLYHFHFRRHEGHDNKSIMPDSIDEVMQRVREWMRIKHYAPRTEKSYLHWIARFLRHVRQHGESGSVSVNDFSGFISHLATKRKVSASTQNQAFNALLLYFRDILHIDTSALPRSVRARQGKRLPSVLSVEEVQRIFAATEPKYSLMIRLLYGSGMRMSELLRLRIQDIDFDHRLVIVHAAKGDKDRTTLLPESLIEALRLHVEKVRALHEQDLVEGFGAVWLPDALARKYPNAATEWVWQFLFPSAKLSRDSEAGVMRRHHVYDKSFQAAMKRAVKRSGISKRASLHTLRHSFATHLLMQGTDIREIQELLGHKSVETTMIYTHVVRQLKTSAISPLDTLNQQQKTIDD